MQLLIKLELLQKENLPKRLHGLPPELVTYILSFCDPTDLIGRCQPVSRLFCDLIKQEAPVWRLVNAAKGPPINPAALWRVHALASIDMTIVKKLDIDKPAEDEPLESLDDMGNVVHHLFSREDFSVKALVRPLKEEVMAGLRKLAIRFRVRFRGGQIVRTEGLSLGLPAEEFEKNNWEMNARWRHDVWQMCCPYNESQVATAVWCQLGCNLALTTLRIDGSYCERVVVEQPLPRSLLQLTQNP